MFGKGIPTLEYAKQTIKGIPRCHLGLNAMYVINIILRHVFGKDPRLSASVYSLTATNLKSQ